VRGSANPATVRETAEQGFGRAGVGLAVEQPRPAEALPKLGPKILTQQLQHRVALRELMAGSRMTG
jgi:hypothetical protein